MMDVLFPNISNIVDILIMVVLIYFALLYIKQLGTYYVLIFSLLYFGLYSIALLLNLTFTTKILEFFLRFWPLALLIVLTPEIRGSLTNSKFLNFVFWRQKKAGPSHLILTAVSLLTRDRRGGIIVIERNSVLDKFFASGLETDAIISPKLIFAVLNKNNILHDGAVIIRGRRILAVKVVLPLSDNTKYTNECGTRHLAAIGITENSDAIAIVVSEESGGISFAIHGNLIKDITIEELSQRLSDSIR